MNKVEALYANDLLLLECISGSTAYGLSLPHSDVDKRGVFVAPKKEFFGLSEVTQVNSASGDDAFSELGRFFELLTKSNPTMVELLHTPSNFVLKKHPLFDQIKKEYYLSKKCKDTFAGYAISQIRKARGLNKKIVNPMDKKRKTVLDFCFIPEEQGFISVREFLENRGWSQA